MANIASCAQLGRDCSQSVNHVGHTALPCVPSSRRMKTASWTWWPCLGKRRGWLWWRRWRRRVGVGTRGPAWLRSKTTWIIFIIYVLTILKLYLVFESLKWWGYWGSVCPNIWSLTKTANISINIRYNPAVDKYCKSWGFQWKTQTVLISTGETEIS